MLRVADGAGRTLAEYPAPEETLLDRVTRILAAAGLPVATMPGYHSVSSDTETVYVTTSSPEAANAIVVGKATPDVVEPSVQTPKVVGNDVPETRPALPRTPRRRRSKAVKVSETPEVTAAPATEGKADGGAENIEASVTSVARKPRVRRKKTVTVAGEASVSGQEGGAPAGSAGSKRTGDLFGESTRGPRKP